MSTAVQLVNRVRRKLRWGDTATFVAPEDLSILDEINGAVATLFEAFDWDCDKRHDGVLLCMGASTYTSGMSLALLATEAFGGLASLYGKASEADARLAVLRVAFTESTEFPQTALRVLQGYFDANLLISVLTLDAQWVGTTLTNTASAQFVANEYGLPSTVRKMISARHQEKNIRLEEVSRSQMFDRAMQRPTETINDDIELIMIGGRCVPTIEAGAGASATPPAYVAPTAMTSVLLWPTPNTDIRIDYTYLLQRSPMTATTDTLANVDSSIENLVVELAYARCINSYVGDADPAMGLAIENRVMTMARVLHANQARDPSRRRIIGSLFDDCRIPTRNLFGVPPRNFGSLP